MIINYSWCVKVERDMSGLAVELNQSSGMMATGPWTKIAKCLYSILIGYPVTINTIRDKLTYGSGSILIKSTKKWLCPISGTG